jgi:hypothetical protein
MAKLTIEVDDKHVHDKNGTPLEQCDRSEATHVYCSALEETVPINEQHYSEWAYLRPKKLTGVDYLNSIAKPGVVFEYVGERYVVSRHFRFIREIHVWNVRNERLALRRNGQWEFERAGGDPLAGNLSNFNAETVTILLEGVG